jgi:GT2 family glycosyltransferase
MAINPRIGVVTVTYNGAAYLPAFFRDCWRQTFKDFILYVIDNGSVDGSLELARSQPDARCVVIANGANLGVAAANNTGIERALADGCTEVLILNNDVEFPPSLFADLDSELARLGAQMLVPKIYFFEPSNRIWCAGGEFLPVYGWATAHRGEGEQDRGQFEESCRIQYAPTCCMLVRSGVFARIGVMDPKYFVYFDDTDFCLRAFRAGEALYYTPKPHLFHKVSSSTGGLDSPFTLRMYSRNKMYYILKNFGLLGWGWVIAYFVYILLLGILGRRGGLATMRIRLAQSLAGIRLALEPGQPSEFPAA